MYTDNSDLSFPVIQQTQWKLNIEFSDSKGTQVTASPVKVDLFVFFK